MKLPIRNWILPKLKRVRQDCGLGSRQTKFLSLAMLIWLRLTRATPRGKKNGSTRTASSYLPVVSYRQLGRAINKRCKGLGRRTQLGGSPPGQDHRRHTPDNCTQSTPR